MKKFAVIMAVAAALMALFVGTAFADAFDQAIARWEKKERYEESGGGNLTIKVTYYSAEYMEAYVQSEAKKNLWTQDETDDFKYKFLSALQLNDMIPIHVKFINNGPSMHLGPFDIMVTLRVKNKTYKPIEYDKRFNFRFQGEKEGLIFFPRRDAKTGKEILAGAKEVFLEFKPSISPVLDGKRPRFVWTVSNDDPSKLYSGTTAVKMETERLLKRLEKIRKDKAEEEAKLKTINDEISTIQNRLDELEKESSVK
ncbi:MAG: hypothetical protein Q4E17_06255 [Synergistes sp.]|nr:hypothetical protein [Synergistes sp.]